MLWFVDFAETLLPSSTKFHQGLVLTEIGLANSGRGKRRSERIFEMGDQYPRCLIV
jgi:hypothetical protein